MTRNEEESKEMKKNVRRDKKKCMFFGCNAFIVFSFYVYYVMYIYIYTHFFGNITLRWRAISTMMCHLSVLNALF